MSPKQHKAPSLISAASTVEHSYFEWFMGRTALKVPGLFSSPFWDTLVFQASYSEPAVLHAVLALSSAHKRLPGSDSHMTERRENIPDEKEQFTLRHYSKSIEFLQPHFSAKSKDSVRVALVTCVMFICLEFLRGHYKIATNHLQNGLKLLSHIESKSARLSNWIVKPASDPHCDPIDDWLVETFARLNLQAILFGQGSSRPRLAPQAVYCKKVPIIFESMSQARKTLDRILGEILDLTECCRQERTFQDSAHQSTVLLDNQRNIQVDLASWLWTHQASRVNLEGQMGVAGTIAHQMLQTYHTMASIMAAACLRPDDEMLFDCHSHGFLSIIAQSINLFKLTLNADLSTTAFQHRPDAFPFVADMGWIPPLYYTAVKCRNHRVRNQAIKLLASVSSKEGIWDALLTVSIAREVIRIEERQFYKENKPLDDFPFDSRPEEKDLALPVLPESYRIHDVQVVLPDSPLEKTVLTCRRRHEDGSWEVLERQYDALSKCWTDKKEMED